MCWAIVPAIIGAAIALPVGAALEPVVARAVVSAEAGPLEGMSPLMPGPRGGAGAVSRPGEAVRYTRHGKAVINAGSPHQRLQGRPQAGGGAPGSPGFFGGLFSIAGQNPYTPGELALLALAGLAVALAGALGPAIWAAASRAITALRAE